MSYFAIFMDSENNTLSLYKAKNSSIVQTMIIFFELQRIHKIMPLAYFLKSYLKHSNQDALLEAQLLLSNNIAHISKTTYSQAHMTNLYHGKYIYTVLILWIILNNYQPLGLPDWV